MSWFSKIWHKLFGRKNKVWDDLDYGKPSTEGDDFVRLNDSNR